MTAAMFAPPEGKALLFDDGISRCVVTPALGCGERFKFAVSMPPLKPGVENAEVSTKCYSPDDLRRAIPERFAAMPKTEVSQSEGEHIFLGIAAAVPLRYASYVVPPGKALAAETWNGDLLTIVPSESDSGLFRVSWMRTKPISDSDETELEVVFSTNAWKLEALPGVAPVIFQRGRHYIIEVDQAKEIFASNECFVRSRGEEF